MKTFLTYLIIFLSVIPALFIYICFLSQLKRDLKELNDDICLKDILLSVVAFISIIITSLIPLINIYFIINYLYDDMKNLKCFIWINKILNYKIIKKSKK